MVVNRKSLIISALSGLILISGSVSNAATSDLLKMDIRKNGASDTVNVVFYTTGDNVNSVVSRKSNERYVVLLPNVSGNNSVVPSLGGVKEYITDVDVKNVNDGIGGYTKVTFTTTKPINIMTSVKKTLPLTKAQLEYKDLLAKNNAKPAIPVSKPVTQAAKKAETKPAVQKISANNNISNTTQVKTVSAPKINTPNKPEFVQKSKQTKSETKTTQNKSIVPFFNNSVQTSAKQAVKQPESIENKQPYNVSENKIIQKTKQKEISKTPHNQNDIINNSDVNNIEAISTVEITDEKNIQTKTSSNNVKTKENKTKFSILSKFKKLSKKKKIGAGLLTLLIIFGLMPKSSKRKEEQYNYDFSAQNQSVDNTKINNYQDIIENDNLNWQEKYKLASQNETDNTQSEEQSYIAKINPKSDKTTNPIKLSYDDIDSRSLLSSNFEYRTHGLNLKTSNRENAQKEKLQDVIAQMENYEGYTYENNYEPEDVLSVDNMIMQHFEDVKQQSFKLPSGLKMSNRKHLKHKSFGNSIKSDIIKQNKSTGLKKTKLTTTRKNSSIVALHPEKILNTKNEVQNMEKDYLQTSLKEYLSLLDNETLNNVNNKTEEVISRTVEQKTRATNPFNNSSMMPKSIETIKSMKGMSVKSKYAIDKNKELYLVNTDEGSAIVGKINNDIKILKKFDNYVTTPLQVRHDEKNVYIVKTGRYKSLVDMSDEKIGVLLEI